ncbi:putative fluoride ion transporter CrcB 1 [Ligilactobacillus salitolerans]|uniref:Fluoride-specific ion channel FluC n=1 Tax=Ligilactobacillus salitolerans TaxID=1808352 RepID=A0A401IVV6_9LACO|nr:fluoride efflux transporter CrcB [Ligilactobacillus salitolerans]GBG95674.1 putative fluoride ion transporter CrcB 1 [Ligilactobacillus salitolerans]
MSIILIGLGAGLGASLRFLATTLIKQHTKQNFPWATLLINLSGAFLLGILVGLQIPTLLYKILGIGLLGGFTTFSTLNVELLTLRRNKQLEVVPYALATYLGGPLALFGGLLLSSLS